MGPCSLGESPIDLEITAGAYTAFMELGGLSLTNLTIKDGASDVNLFFSEKNRITNESFPL